VFGNYNHVSWVVAGLGVVARLALCKAKAQKNAVITATDLLL
jgi:hypothetical protein